MPIDASDTLFPGFTPVDHGGDGGLLGEGATGKVYHVRDTELDEVFALKYIKASAIAGPAHKAVLQREARQQRKLKHVGIVKVERAFEHNGGYVLVLEYCNRGSLAQVAEAHGGLPVEVVMTILLQVSSALAFAHRNNLIHRDIKPHNLLVHLNKDDQIEIKIADFGLAQPPSTETGVTHRSFRGQRPFEGSIAYASLEQLRGRPVTARSDLFSLGVTLWFLLRGECPFPTTNPWDIAMSRQDPGRYEDELPSFLDPDCRAIIGKLIEKQADARYESADALYRDTAAWLQRHCPSGLPRWIDDGAHPFAPHDFGSGTSPADPPPPPPAAEKLTLAAFKQSFRWQESGISELGPVGVGVDPETGVECWLTQWHRDIPRADANTIRGLVGKLIATPLPHLAVPLSVRTLHDATVLIEPRHLGLSLLDLIRTWSGRRLAEQSPLLYRLAMACDAAEEARIPAILAQPAEIAAIPLTQAAEQFAKNRGQSSTSASLSAAVWDIRVRPVFRRSRDASSSGADTSVQQTIGRARPTSFNYQTAFLELVYWTLAGRSWEKEDRTSVFTASENANRLLNEWLVHPPADRSALQLLEDLAEADGSAITPPGELLEPLRQEILASADDALRGLTHDAASLTNRLATFRAFPAVSLKEKIESWRREASANIEGLRASISAASTRADLDAARLALSQAANRTRSGKAELEQSIGRALSDETRWMTVRDRIAELDGPWPDWSALRNRQTAGCRSTKGRIQSLLDRVSASWQSRPSASRQSTDTGSLAEPLTAVRSLTGSLQSAEQTVLEHFHQARAAAADFSSLQTRAQSTFDADSVAPLPQQAAQARESFVGSLKELQVSRDTLARTLRATRPHWQALLRHLRASRTVANFSQRLASARRALESAVDHATRELAACEAHDDPEATNLRQFVQDQLTRVSQGIDDLRAVSEQEPSSDASTVEVDAWKELAASPLKSAAPAAESLKTKLANYQKRLQELRLGKKVAAAVAALDAVQAHLQSLPPHPPAHWLDLSPDQLRELGLARQMDAGTLQDLLKKVPAADATTWPGDVRDRWQRLQTQAAEVSRSVDANSRWFSSAATRIERINHLQATGQELSADAHRLEKNELPPTKRDVDACEKKLATITLDEPDLAISLGLWEDGLAKVSNDLDSFAARLDAFLGEVRIDRQASTDFPELAPLHDALENPVTPLRADFDSPHGSFGACRRRVASLRATLPPLRSLLSVHSDLAGLQETLRRLIPAPGSSPLSKAAAKGLNTGLKTLITSAKDLQHRLTASSLSDCPHPRLQEVLRNTRDQITFFIAACHKQRIEGKIAWRRIASGGGIGAVLVIAAVLSGLPDSPFRGGDSTVPSENPVKLPSVSSDQEPTSPTEESPSSASSETPRGPDRIPTLPTIAPDSIIIRTNWSQNTNIPELFNAWTLVDATAHRPNAQATWVKPSETFDGDSLSKGSSYSLWLRPEALGASPYLVQYSAQSFSSSKTVLIPKLCNASLRSPLQFVGSGILPLRPVKIGGEAASDSSNDTLPTPTSFETLGQGIPEEYLLTVATNGYWQFAVRDNSWQYSVYEVLNHIVNIFFAVSSHGTNTAVPGFVKLGQPYIKIFSDASLGGKPLNSNQKI